MLEAIQSNPYRILGVYSNSPKKDVVANKGKMTAFLKVGRTVSFPLDLNNKLSPIERNTDVVTQADADLSLAGGQIKYGQFWFIKVTPIDDIAFNHLLAGNMDSAMEMWAKKASMSSLQNQLVCHLIRSDYRQAIACAETLYANYAAELVTTIAGDTIRMSSSELASNFLDVLTSSNEIETSELFGMISNEEWKAQLSGQLVTPLIQQIDSAISEAKQKTEGGAQASLRAGTKLMNGTKPLLKQLKTLLPTADLQYQMIADKLGLQILQCGINYYNGSDDDDAALKAMKLQKYAQSIVVGSMAKDRCAENTKILQKVIDRLPPKEIMDEYRMIMNELESFCRKPDLIVHAVALLKNTKPQLDTIKTKLQTLQYSAVGSTIKEKHQELSTQIVGNALHNLIEEVNAAQKDIEIKMLIDREGTLNDLKSVLREALDTMMLMDDFEIEYKFKIDRYLPQRNSLINLCSQLGIYATKKRRASTTSQNVSRQTKTTSTYRPTQSTKSSSTDSNYGCLIWIIVWIVSSVIIGIIVDANGGDGVGSFMGVTVILSIIYRLVQGLK